MAEANGIYYVRARYYDSAVGRFISEDPKGFEAGLNLYAYALNNPIAFVDINGRSAQHIYDRYGGIALATIGLGLAIADAPAIVVVGVILASEGYAYSQWDNGNMTTEQFAFSSALNIFGGVATGIGEFGRAIGSASALGRGLQDFGRIQSINWGIGSFGYEGGALANGHGS